VGAVVVAVVAVVVVVVAVVVVVVNFGSGVGATAVLANSPPRGVQIGLVRAVLRAAGAPAVPVGACRPDHPKRCVAAFYRSWLPFVEEEADGEGHDVMARAFAAHPRARLFTGAPLGNLHALLLRHPDTRIEMWVAQGGFAGEGVVPPAHVLPQFEGRVVCPTYNFGGHAAGAALALASGAIGLKVLVSKNVCHGVVYDRTFHLELAALICAGGRVHLGGYMETGAAAGGGGETTATEQTGSGVAAAERVAESDDGVDDDDDAPGPGTLDCDDATAAAAAAPVVVSAAAAVAAQERRLQAARDAHLVARARALAPGGLRLMLEGMELYLARHRGGKKFHDPLALAVALDPWGGVCEFREVECFQSRGGGGWGSRLAAGTGTFVSVAHDRGALLRVLCGRAPPTASVAIGEHLIFE
jgi:hypothetical protein